MCNETPNHSSFTWLQIFLTVLIKGVFSREEALILQYRGRAEIFKARPWDLAEQFFLEATQLKLAMLRGTEGEDAVFGLLLLPLNPFPGGSFNPRSEPKRPQAPAAGLASAAALPAHSSPVLFPDFSLLAADTAALCTALRGKAGVFGGGGGGGINAAGLAADRHSSRRALRRAPWLPIQDPSTTLCIPGQQGTGKQPHPSQCSARRPKFPPEPEAYVNVWV